jgi:hypothetical protein
MGGERDERVCVNEMSDFRMCPRGTWMHVCSRNMT